MRRPPVVDAIRSGVPVSGPWGHVSVTPHEVARMKGDLSARIHVYPPGMTAAARRFLHARGFVMSWTALILASLAVGASFVIGQWVGLAIAAAVVVGIFLALTFGTRRSAAQTQVVSLYASGAGTTDPALFLALAEQLDALDSAGYDPVQYEAEWWRIYRALQARRAA